MAAANPALALPTGHALILADEVRDRLLAGVVCLTDVAVREEPAVWAETAELAEHLRVRYAGRLPSEIAPLQAARDLYKSFGMDPSRHRPSSEALLRRVLKGQDLYRLNCAVDCCNLASLRCLLPIGMYDLQRIDGDAVLRVGRPGEQYPGIRKGPVHLTGRLGLFDVQGPFGSPTSDSARTCVTVETAEILAVLMAPASYRVEEMQAHLDGFCDLFARHCGARTVLSGVLEGSTDASP